jgi:predicted MFS family arabinose efflux permease
MMGALNAVQNGLGRGTGTLLGGYLYEKYGASFMWLLTDLGVPLSLIGLLLFSWSMNQPERTPHSRLLSPTSVEDA